MDAEALREIIKKALAQELNSQQEQEFERMLREEPGLQEELQRLAFEKTEGAGSAELDQLLNQAKQAYHDYSSQFSDRNQGLHQRVLAETSQKSFFASNRFFYWGSAAAALVFLGVVVFFQLTEKNVPSPPSQKPSHYSAFKSGDNQEAEIFGTGFRGYLEESKQAFGKRTALEIQPGTLLKADQGAREILLQAGEIEIRIDDQENIKLHFLPWGELDVKGPAAFRIKVQDRQSLTGESKEELLKRLKDWHSSSDSPGVYQIEMLAGGGWLWVEESGAYTFLQAQDGLSLVDGVLLPALSDEKSQQHYQDIRQKLEKHFANFDHNANDVLENEEIQEELGERLLRVDWNEDGQVSKSEFIAGGLRKEHRKIEGGKRKRRIIIGSVFEQVHELDINKNGLLEETELPKDSPLKHLLEAEGKSALSFKELRELPQWKEFMRKSMQQKIKQLKMQEKKPHAPRGRRMAGPRASRKIPKQNKPEK